MPVVGSFANASVRGLGMFAAGGSIPVEYVVVAGGGSSTADSASNSQRWSTGGGGAGGYRSSVIGESSGGGASAEAVLQLKPGAAYTVTVGAGAAQVPVGAVPSTSLNGSPSQFESIVSLGGGVSVNISQTNNIDLDEIFTTSGGSGAGHPLFGTSNNGTTGQGYNGGSSYYGDYVLTYPLQFDTSIGGGGGGASAPGKTFVNDYSDPNLFVLPDGGNGITTNITGSPLSLAGGGGGGGVYFNENPRTWGNGGSGGGGDGGEYNGPYGQNGAANTGGGGGGNFSEGNVTRFTNGGSGIVIIRIPDTYTATFSAGVTSSMSTAVSGFKVYTITATSTTSETVTFS